VVNNQPNVSEPVRKRVLEVIQKTGYHPNAAARTLASSRSWMIGLVLPRSVSSFFTDPYFPRLTQGIAQACNQYNYILGLFLIGNKKDEDEIYPRISRKGFLDGLIVQSGQFGDRLIDSLIASNIPLVIAGRPFHNHETSYVDVDNVNAAYNAVNHLIQLGYRRIATITGIADSTVTIDRREGYLKALTEQGMAINDALIANGEFSEEGGYAAMLALLSARPDAVFAASDNMAIGAMRAVREAGLRIPQDIAFVGFDDLPLAKFPEPQLTTVRQPISRFGFKAVETLIDLIDNGIKPARRIIMDTELVIRESCGAKLQVGA
jgi:LacI family transcriptional regulator